MFYRLLGRIFFILWVAPAISELVRKILYPALRDAFEKIVVKETAERRKKERFDSSTKEHHDYTSNRVGTE